jgi:uncharacterized phage protein gp47/JayE
MKITQNWVGRLDRSYEQVKRSLLTRLKSNAPEITDHSESNPLITLMGMFAGVAEVLNLYMDSLSRESFLGTARRFKSVAKLVKLIDYNIKARGYATANVLFTLTDNGGALTFSAVDIIIPAGSIINSISNSIAFKLLNTVTIPAGSSGAYGLVAQYSEVINVVLGNTDGTVNQTVQISDKYVQNTMKLNVNGVDYARYNSFGLMNPTTKGYVIEIDENQKATIKFGDGVNGVIPNAGQAISASYWESEGALGNVPPETLTMLSTVVVLPAGTNLTVSNPDYASGGEDFEGMEDIRNRAPRSLRSLDRAVTYQDYIDVAMQVVGVGAAEVSYCCGKFVSVYVVPSSRGVATRALLNQVQDYLECRKMITTKIDVKPAGISRVYIQANVVAKPFFTSDATLAEVLAALDLNFGQNATSINKKVIITDIIAAMEALKSVDSFQIIKVNIEPYSRPINNTQNVLQITYPNLPTGTVKTKYSIIYRANNNKFEVYNNGIFVQLVGFNEVFQNGANLSFKITGGIYNANDQWELTAFPSYPEIFPNTIINIDDFSAPVVDVSPFVSDAILRTIFGQITVTTSSPTSNCLPPC